MDPRRSAPVSRSNSMAGFNFMFTDAEQTQRRPYERTFSVPHLPSLAAYPHRAALPRFLSISNSVRSKKTYNPKPYFRSRRIKKVFVDDFSNGFNSTIWSREVQTGGFSNGEFEMTTGDDENVFVRDGNLIIKPTVQTENYISSTKVVNLTSAGTCTSNTPSDCIIDVSESSDIVQPTKSGRITTKNFAVIRYGRVDVTAKLAAGDWLLSQIMMQPAENYYGPWPESGQIDLAMARGNNYSYGGGGGNNVVQSSLHWGTDTTTDRWQLTTGTREALHSTYSDGYHTFGLEWTHKYLFMWMDTRLAQVTYIDFNVGFFKRGGFHVTYDNGTRIVNPWTGANTSNTTPFDRPFYLTLALSVGGTSGWFTDGVQGKPWVDASTTPRRDFWKAREQWKPTWEKEGHGELAIKKVSMWQQCDNGATDL
ncbi:putative glycoside hydrolase family 16 protein [Phaeomoniella chlamydospora]|uniref:Putative glycoside hydrolase family 16 protein n=1 Tax=Phaeomoniella chlamydospora TaxID=158046 RepID=A0A0G2FYH4_PHACM|nr:putative glycoside hydrolase family 16 protein [Phaeomoniella chlamydospora]